MLMSFAELQNPSTRSRHYREVAESPSIKKILSTNVDALMQKYEMTQTDLAKKSGVSQRHISNIKNGKTGAGVDKVAKIAAVFKRPAWVLLLHDMPLEILDSDALPELVKNYRHSNKYGREAIDAYASREAIHNQADDKILRLTKSS